MDVWYESILNYCFVCRCGTCMDCPNCFNALSVRATSLSRVSEDGAKTPGKVYYLACFICRWTTRDVGIPDQTAGLTDSLIVLVLHLVFSLRSYSTSKDSGQQSGLLFCSCYPTVNYQLFCLFIFVAISRC